MFLLTNQNAPLDVGMTPILSGHCYFKIFAFFFLISTKINFVFLNTNWIFVLKRKKNLLKESLRKIK